MTAISIIKNNLDRYISANPSIIWTVRQLYYRLVSDQIIANSLTSYKGFDKQLVTLREQGQIDDAILVDNARRIGWVGDEASGTVSEFFRERLEGIASDSILYSRSLWEKQKYNLIFVLEKDALSRLVGQVCDRYRVPLAVGRGYSSRTQILNIGQYLKEDKENVVLYLGDHDPTGLDIERSADQRLGDEGNSFSIKRIALTFDQATERNLPPNPTKSADARTPGYVAQYGNQCWELDALPPQELQDMVRKAILGYINVERWNRDIEKQKNAKARLDERFEAVAKFLAEKFPDDDETDDDEDDDEDEDNEDSTEEPDWDENEGSDQDQEGN